MYKGQAFYSPRPTNVARVGRGWREGFALWKGVSGWKPFDQPPPKNCPPPWSHKEGWVWVSCAELESGVILNQTGVTVNCPWHSFCFSLEGKEWTRPHAISAPTLYAASCSLLDPCANPMRDAGGNPQKRRHWTTEFRLDELEWGTIQGLEPRHLKFGGSYTWKRKKGLQNKILKNLGLRPDRSFEGGVVAEGLRGGNVKKKECFKNELPCGSKA